MSKLSLREAVASMPGAWFAVVDGGHFDDLPARLRYRGLNPAALYLEANNEDGVRAGPYLVAVETQSIAATLLDLLEGKPAVTFWSWPGTLDTLRRHLRGLNLVEIPNDRRTAPDDPAYETVLFRHWDPNVLAVTLPVLAPVQYSRILGAAAGVAFDADEYAGVMRVKRPDELPPKTRGILRLLPEQIAAITARRVAASRRRIAGYLREVAPEHSRNMHEQAMVAAIVRFEREALAFGLTAEPDIGRWAYLQLVAGGTLAEQESIHAFFSSSGDRFSPTKKLDALFMATANLARRST